MKIPYARIVAVLLAVVMMAPLFAGDLNVRATFRNPPPLDAALWLPDKQPDARIRYGEGSVVQFGDLRLPDLNAPAAGYPVVIFIHGGGWLADWTKDYSSRFVESLTREGFATWDLEFRRMGNAGGGYPGTFLDVAAGADHVRALAETYPLDVERVVAVGHSSGGHLALWLAGRKNLAASSHLHTENPLLLVGVVSLAGVNDLERSVELGNRKDVLDLLGAESQQAAEARFAETNPARLLPFGVPQALIVGTLDAEWRIAMTHEYAAASRLAGDEVHLDVLTGADHGDVVDAESPAVELVARVIGELLDEVRRQAAVKVAPNTVFERE